jgi:photosystem II stability/assembly factor-like uncharacterized protein
MRGPNATLYGVAFLSSKAGFAVGDNGTILKISVP